MSALHILSIQAGKPQAMLHQDPRDGKESEWVSGIFKAEAPGPVWVGKENLDGDGQADLQFHGGPDRAVLLFNIRHYADYEPKRESKIPNGGFGENLTVEGPDEREVCLGDRWVCGDVVLEVSQPRLPCFKLGRRLEFPEVVKLTTDARAAGWYCRVLREGFLQAGDTLRLEARPHPEWTICRAFETYASANDAEAVRSLLEVPAISQLWRERLPKKLQ